FHLVHLGLRDFSSFDKRLHAGRREAWPRLAHAQIQSRGLEPVVPAEFLVVIGAVSLHVLGDGPGGPRPLTTRRTKASKQRRQVGLREKTPFHGPPFGFARRVLARLQASATPTVGNAVRGPGTAGTRPRAI